MSAADVEALVGLMEGYSGSDMAQVCRDAAMEPVRQLLCSQPRKRRRGGAGVGAGDGGAEGSQPTGSMRITSSSVRKLCRSDFESALARIRPPQVDAAQAAAAAGEARQGA